MEPAFGQLLFTFSVNLYKQLLSADSNANASNLLCSPLTIAAALGMTLAGARNNTAKQIRALFVEAMPSGSRLSDGRGTSDDAIHAAFASLMMSLSRVFDDNHHQAPSGGVTLRLANRLYTGLDVQPSPEYAALVNASYGASAASVDFGADPESARRAINEWVSRETASKIAELLPRGSVEASTCAALVNAVYFRGLWADQFEPELTAEEPFYETPTKSRKVKMMYKNGRFAIGRHEGLGVSLVTIPYRGLKASMVVVLPDKVDGLADFEQRVTPSELASLISSANSTTKVRLRLPRFKLSTTTDLLHTLSSMGVTDLFSPRADLSGIAATLPSSGSNSSASPAGCGRGTAGGVSVALHSAAIEVTEEGTEAAAGSASILTRRDAVEFTADHPFLFLVRTQGTTPLEADVVLFVGSVRRVDDVEM
uniref:Serine protease inhibitor n=1 Tax=Amblyomma americanum TaxID=6943 RepID=A0A0E9Y1H4_AMBAM